MSDVANYELPEPKSEINFATYGSSGDVNFISILLASPLMLFAAFRALTRKQA